MGRDDVRNDKRSASIGISRTVFLVIWVLVLVFWVFADVRVVFLDADPNVRLLGGLPYFTLFTSGVWILVFCLITLAAYLFFWYVAKR